MKAQDFISAKGNLEAYHKWRDNPITRAVLECLREECRPRQVPVNSAGIPAMELSSYLLGQGVGEDRVLRRIEKLDIFPKTPETADIQAKYGMIDNLKDQGYSDVDANRITEEFLKNEQC